MKSAIKFTESRTTFHYFISQNKNKTTTDGMTGLNSLFVVLLLALLACVHTNVVLEQLPTAADEEVSDADLVKLFGNNRKLSDCTNWHKKEPDPSAILMQVRKSPCRCPPSFPKSFHDGTDEWTTDPGCDASKQPNTCSYHIGAHGCYRHTYTSKGPGTQACYDKNGDWIADPRKGAGTLDKYNAVNQNLFHLLNHYNHDVVPWNNCCDDASLPENICDLYYEKRPPGECQHYRF
ncbi:unnamed protein product [Didymodactylos carnosus]|uniref:AMOP domain-containing protein n=2 Tax=Didymodactylos carnosus TaxID=1234261 RepID=A0A8S2GUF2_9BILA|nr:unnamed protein product [Didymodactylos carnosus]CAF3562202.1 unnamed protein product [Didymodactylos carnosus]